MSTHLEHDYIGLTEPLERTPEKLSNENVKHQDSCMNLKETELRLGLPGSQSPERKPALSVSLFGNSVNVANNGACLGSLKSPVSGAKRGYCDALDGSSPKWSLVKPLGVLENNSNSSSQHACVSDAVKNNKDSSVASSAKPVPASKTQVVGWPPIRSYRKNSMASNIAKNNDDSESKSSECLYVKVSMDGAPYLRKVDLKIYKNYMDLSAGLEKMFSCFTIGQYGSNGLPGRDGLTESRLMDLLNGSEYVLTYEDKDGDWMLVGDVPWEMFTASCRRLRIMKSSEAIGLAPRAMEKCKTRN